MAKRIAPQAAPAPLPAPATTPAPAAPDAAAVAAVTDAARTLDVPGTAEEAKDRELALAAPVFDVAAAAGAAVGADGAQDQGGDADAEELAPLDAARAAAQAQADAENDNPSAPEPLKLIDFPCDIRVLNNSRISLTEKVSGAFIGAGNSATITLHDEDYASAVAKSLTKLVEENYIDRKSIVVHPA